MTLERRDAMGTGTVASRAASEARAAAVEAVRAVEEGERDSLDRLRAAVCTYLSALRAEGTEKSAALDEVRAVIATPVSDNPGWLLPAAREALMDLAMHWCIEQYAD